MINFNSIDYLKYGNLKQQLAYDILTENHILKDLQEFDPVLVGTIPIDIDIENSDLDIICCWTNKNNFVQVLTRLFTDKTDFKINLNEELNCITANFTIGNFEIEIFGQNIPVRNQLGYRHMLIEYQLLVKHGSVFREKIIELKKQGFKTEPAFAFLLGLKGNPYEELLKYENDQSQIILNPIIK